MVSEQDLLAKVPKPFRPMVAPFLGELIELAAQAQQRAEHLERIAEDLEGQVSELRDRLDLVERRG